MGLQCESCLRDNADDATRSHDEIGPGRTYEDLTQGRFKKLTIVTKPWDRMTD